jgi:hypothetical protein
METAGQELDNRENQKDNRETSRGRDMKTRRDRLIEKVGGWRLISTSSMIWLNHASEESGMEVGLGRCIVDA